MKRSIYLLLSASVAASACGPEDAGECVTVVDEDVEEETTWGEECVTVEVMTDANVAAPLTIVEGTTVRFDQKTSLYTREQGSINAVGTESAPIVFEGFQPEPGYWRGLAFRTLDDTNQLEHVTISDTGENPRTIYPGSQAAAILVGGGGEDGSVELHDVAIDNVSGFGLNVFEGAKIEGSTDVTFSGMTNEPIRIAFAEVHQLDPSFDVELESVETTSIDVTGGKLSEIVEWRDMFGPYVLEDSTIDAGGMLQAEAGTRIGFDQDALLRVAADAALALNGEEDAPVKLLGTEGVPGFWAGIDFESFSPDNVISHVVIESAGAKLPGRAKVAFRLENRSSLNVSNTAFLVSDGHGIQVLGDSELTESDNDFSGLSGHPIVDKDEEAITP